jgi:hypothetical protein
MNINDNYNSSFQGYITCKGFISDEKPDKIRFRQDYVDCWIKKSDLKKIERIEKTHEGDTLVLVTVTEEIANVLELEGVLE